MDQSKWVAEGGAARADELTAQANASAYYEKRYSSWGLRYHRKVIAWMMEGIWPDWNVLDAGCGTGIISRLNPSHNILGIDLSREMIARCPSRRLQSHLFMVKDVTDLSDWKADWGEAVVCRSLLHHLPDHKKALKEFHRVLKPGGRFVCWETNKGWLAQKVREKTQHGDRFSEYHHAFKAGELEQDLRAAGFVVEEVRYMGFTAYPLFGFPDILDLASRLPFKPVLYRACQGLDLLLEKVPGVRRMAWAVGIKARKA